MFPQTKWSSGLLLVSALVALLLTAQADDTQCTDEKQAEICELCADKGLGVSAKDCCSNSKHFNRCKACVSGQSSCSPSGDIENKLAGRIRREPLDQGLDLFNPANDDTFDEDKRAKYFLGKRAKYFLGKRSDDFEGSDGVAEFPEDLDEEKRAKYFLGKRAKYFLGKRAKYFLGKRDYDDEDELALNRRAKYFLGKRAKYFLGKRDDDKRAKYFLGKRYDDDGLLDAAKRQKYFLGKRSTDNMQ